MLTMVIFFKRRAGMSPEAFQQHWRTVHAGIITRLPGLRRYVQNHVHPSAYRKGEPQFDAIAESSFDDTEAMKSLAKSREYEAVLADEPNFIDRSSMGSIITEPHVVKDGRAGTLKSIALLKRKTGMPIDEFFAYWKNEHGALCARVPAFRRYVQCPTRRSGYTSGRTPAYDGVAMVWYESGFENMEALREASGQPEFAALRADLDKFMDAEHSPSLFVREEVVLAG